MDPTSASLEMLRKDMAFCFFLAISLWNHHVITLIYTEVQLFRVGRTFYRNNANRSKAPPWFKRRGGRDQHEKRLLRFIFMYLHRVPATIVWLPSCCRDVTREKKANIPCSHAENAIKVECVPDKPPEVDRALTELRLEPWNATIVLLLQTVTR